MLTRDKKIEWRRCPTKKIEDIFIRFDRMYESARQTDKHRTTAAALA